MREIKFRYRIEHATCSSKLAKTYKRIITIYYFTLKTLESGTFSKILETLYSPKIISRDSYIGLKDKNGKKIYEGDIIHVWEEYDKGKRVYDTGNWEVYWKNDHWHLRRQEGDYSLDYYQGDEDLWPNVDNWIPSESGLRMEKIGNIYENLELLKAIKSQK